MIGAPLANSTEADCCPPGLVHPSSGPLKKDLAWKAVMFGPVTAWSVNCDANEAQVRQRCGTYLNSILVLAMGGC